MKAKQLALGTVQFGLPYGVAGRGEAVPEVEVRAILRRAQALGIRTLDTAAAYGDIEARLSDLGSEAFDVVSKLAALPQDIETAAVADWVWTQAERSRARLGGRLVALMVHRDEDLTGALGAATWSSLRDWGRRHGIAVGASCYDPARMSRLAELNGFAVVQAPGNALDQRAADAGAAVSNIEVHLRSVFLQGLLLMEPRAAKRAVPAATAALARWHAWCAAQALDARVAALSIVKSFEAVGTCVVGVDSLAQLEEIAAAWAEAAPLRAPELACGDAAVIDPRTWRAQR
jgi:aryl-alcohol dehydrogenase-like predicted oxidoreductase